MTISAHKAFYVTCDECHYESFEFRKKDVKRRIMEHDCEKHLRRTWNYANRGIMERFQITIKRKDA